MTFCSVSLIALFIVALGIFIFRKPSKAELNKLRLAGYTKPFMEISESVDDYVLNYLIKK